MSLNMIPNTKILDTLNKITENVTDERILKLKEYIIKTWITSKTWQIKHWCVFRKNIRTNNDCEGELLYNMSLLNSTSA